MLIGAQVEQVVEPVFDLGNQLKRSEPVLCIEFEAYPEAKLLKLINLRWLIEKYGSPINVARAIGVSEAFVRQKSNQKK